MKTSFLCLAGLLLAAPLTAQTDNAQELKAAELLRLSAEKAAAGHETAAAELAEKAMHMLRQEAEMHRALAAEAAEQAYAQALAELGYLGDAQEPKVKTKTRGIMIVDGPDGREVIEFTPDSHGENGHANGLFEVHVEECEDSCDEGCVSECEEEDVWFSAEEDDFFFAQAPHQDDLHHQLASIQHELEALRHELAMLRAEMGGHSGMRAPRMQFRVAPGMQGMHELHSMDLEFPELDHVFEWIEEAPHAEHGLHGGHGQHEEHEVYIERHESSENGAKVETRLKVVIDGEVYEGEEARRMLEEKGLEMPQMRMRMQALPTPPTPPTPPAPRGEWRRSSGEEEL